MAISIFIFIILTIIGPCVCTDQLEVGPLVGHDTTLLLQRRNHTEVFSRAVTFLDSIRSEAVCHQVAALDLVRTCEGLDANTGASEASELGQLYEGVKIEFTVRLALCELKTATSSIPKDCLRFLPSPDACPRESWWRSSDSNSKKLCYWPSDQQQIDLCASSLAASAQSWISYSNARQNAIYVCQAVRDSNDKELWISQQRAFLKTNEELVQANEETIGRYGAAQAAFDASLRQFEQSTAEKLAEVSRETKSVIKNLMAAAQSAIFQVYRKASEASATMDDVTEGIRSGKTQADGLKSDLIALREDVAHSNTQVRDAHTQGLAVVRAQTQELEVAMRRHLAAELETFRDFATMMRSNLREAHSEMMEGIDVTAAKLKEKSMEVEEAFGKIAQLAAAMTWQGFGTVSFALVGFIAAHKILHFLADETAAHLFSVSFGSVAALVICLPYELKPAMQSLITRAITFLFAHQVVFHSGFVALVFAIITLCVYSIARSRKRESRKTPDLVLPTISRSLSQCAAYTPSVAGHTLLITNNRKG